MNAYHIMSNAAERAVTGEYTEAAALYDRAADAWERAEDEEMADGCRAAATHYGYLAAHEGELS